MKQEMLLQDQVIENKRRQLSMIAATQLLGGNMIGLATPAWQSDILGLENEIAQASVVDRALATLG